MMAPSERAKQMRRDAEGGSAAAQASLGIWHLQGAEGLEQDHEKAVAMFRTAAYLGDVVAQLCLTDSYRRGRGVEQNDALAVEFGRKAADQGHMVAQFLVGKAYTRGAVGVKKDLPLGKRYLELSVAQGGEEAVELLKELRKCVACCKLDVHHMVCTRCHNRRYCDKTCLLRHWNHPTDPHTLSCVKRREAAGAGGSSSELAGPSPDSNN